VQEISGNYFLQPGYIKVSNEPVLISTVLGSCVAVCLYDRKLRLGGMNHFLLPYILDPEKMTARYGNVAIVTLIRIMLDAGAETKYLEAQIFGGAQSKQMQGSRVGAENIAIARKILARKKISVASEDVGGRKGRKIVFNTASNEVAVLKVQKLRTTDWNYFSAGKR
jgi:chemotaxis protein CheD